MISWFFLPTTHERYASLHLCKVVIVRGGIPNPKSATLSSEFLTVSLPVAI